MIIVVAKATIKPDQRDKAVQLALQMAETTRTEPGCISYNFYASLGDPNTIFVYEEWETEEALGRHFQTEHMKTFQSQLPDLLAGEMTVQQYVAEAVS